MNACFINSAHTLGYELFLFRHTYTEDVEAESLRNWLADQLIWKTVKAHMPSEVQVSLFFVLSYLKTGRTKNILNVLYYINISA